MKFLINCFLLIFPIILWNYILYPHLPEAYQAEVFWDTIPDYISIPENALRLPIFILPFIMKIDFNKKKILLYFLGLGIYFLSWIFQLYYPESAWSQSMIGFIAPAFTSLFVILSIGIVGRHSYVPQIKNIGSVYIVIGTLFVIFHTWHAYLVFTRIQ